MLQECIIKVDFKPFLSGVLFLLVFFSTNVYMWIEFNEASGYGVKVVLA